MPRLGSGSGAISVRTFRAGPAARAGHDLVLEVMRWEADVDLAAGTVTLDADPRSLRVREAHGGLKPLGRAERGQIARTIDRRILRGRPIAFRATGARPGPAGALVVTGDLTLNGETHALRVYVDDHGHGAVSATIRLRQTAWGIRPYRAALGALRVRDDVEVVIDARLPAS